MSPPAAPRPALWGLRLLSLAAVIGFVWLGQQIRAGTPAWDTAFWRALGPWRSPGLDQGMHLISLLGSGLGLGLFALLLLWWHWRVRPDPGVLRGFLWVNLGGAVLAWPLKFAFARSRPPLNASFDGIGPGFPSGHAMAALLFAGYLAWLLLRQRPRPRQARRLAILLLLLAILSGLSRVYLGAHYLSDVLAGYCAGIVWLTLCLGLHPPVAPRLSGACFRQPEPGASGQIFGLDETEKSSKLYSQGET